MASNELRFTNPNLDADLRNATTPREVLAAFGITRRRKESLTAAMRRHKLTPDQAARVNSALAALHQRTGEQAESMLKDRSSMNALLVKLGLPEEPSATKARAAVAALFINIYDFVNGEPKTFGSLAELRAYTRKNALVFPRQVAKDQGMRVLLKKLGGGEPGQ